MKVTELPAIPTEGDEATAFLPSSMDTILTGFSLFLFKIYRIGFPRHWLPPYAYAKIAH
jgi:hypothetical protein